MLPETICRLCLSESPVRFSVLEAETAQMVESLTSIKVNPNDGPTTICAKCLLNLKLAFKIQQNMKKCDAKLKQQLATGSIVKEEAVIKQEFVEITDDGEIKLENSSNMRIEQLVKVSNPRCVICWSHLPLNSINQHVNEHFQAQQNCGDCKETFGSIASYRVHTKSKHGGSPVYKCEKCEVKLLHKSLFDLHLKQAHSLVSVEAAISQLADGVKGNVTKLGIKSQPAIKLLLAQKTAKQELYTCSTCSKQFASKRAIKSHTHKKETCPICKKSLSIHNIRRHIEKHSSETQVCTLCGLTYRNKDSLRQHVFYNHSEFRYKCGECGKAFRKKTHKDMHERKTHTGIPTHICDTCGKKFYTFHYLDKHIKMKHLKLRPYKCKVCEKAFSSTFALKTHMRQHTNETPYKCEICGMGFRQNVSLRGHRKSKHNIIEPKVVDCKVCGKGFISEQALEAHSRLH